MLNLDSFILASILISFSLMPISCFSLEYKLQFICFSWLCLDARLIYIILLNNSSHLLWIQLNMFSIFSWSMCVFLWSGFRSSLWQTSSKWALKFKLPRLCLYTKNVYFCLRPSHYMMMCPFWPILVWLYVYRTRKKGLYYYYFLPRVCLK